MNGYDILISTLQHFEQSLGTSKSITSVNELAQISGYSAHHLSRLFYSHTELKLKEYLQGRLLFCLLSESLAKDIPFSKLITNYGFKDYETFYRACKHHYGINPSQIKQEGIDPMHVQQKIYPRRNEATKELQVDYREEGKIILCGLSFFVGPETKSFHSCWQKFSRYQNAIKIGGIEPVCYQYTAWVAEESEDMSLLCAMQVESVLSQEPIFNCRTIEPCTYVRFIHSKAVTEIRETYQYIYGTYFANSNDTIIGNWELQRYSKEHAEIEILIPVQM